MKKILFFFLLGLITRQEVEAQFSITKNLADHQDTLCFRDTTMYLIIHTTDGGWPGCTDWMKRWHIGNYVINKKGLIEAMTDDERWVNHAGHSMWIDTNVSLFSVGIELEQYKGSALTAIQLEALAWLIDTLQKKYHIPDSCVLTHPQVACWYPDDLNNPRKGYYLRGRKHDALEFADDDFRAKVGLDPGPTYDPDAMMQRVIPNPYQERLFYGKNFSSAEKLAYQTSVHEARALDSLRAVQATCAIDPILVCTVDRISSAMYAPGFSPLADAMPVQAFSEKKEEKFSFIAILPRRLRFARE